MQIQQSSKYIDTNNLILSFGWSREEAFVQHDITEFYNLLFESIELSG